MDNDVLNLEQSIEFFGVSERTMIKLLRENVFPQEKLGVNGGLAKQHYYVGWVKAILSIT